ncbi:MAG TPA: hypothetical protein VFT74_01740 [Isosphaeraceae bacterium]|nr:hypothetical protein [Isosphaeraceae bacterium]
MPPDWAMIGFTIVFVILLVAINRPPSVESNTDPAMWVRSRQYTGRIVTVTNDRIFDEPVYNSTRDFPYIWEELDDEAWRELRKRYLLEVHGLKSTASYRWTINWVELSVRFVRREHGIRDLKDRMSRAWLERLREAGIGVASSTFEIVGLPTVYLERERHERVG